MANLDICGSNFYERAMNLDICGSNFYERAIKVNKFPIMIEIALHFHRSKNFQFESFDEQLFKIFLNIESFIFGQIVKNNLIFKIGIIVPFD